MCGPLAIPIALAVAGAVTKMAGQYAEGKAAYTQATYEQSAAEANARHDEQNVRDSIDLTKQEAARRQRQAASLEGNQTAAMAANGIDLGFGSAVDVVKDDKQIAAEDVGSIYTQGFRQQQGYFYDLYNDQLKGSAARARAKSAKTSTGIGMLGTALGAASQIAGMKFG